MIRWTPKDSSATKSYTVDWSEIGDDTIASQTFTVVSGTATVSSSDISGLSVLVLIAGGTAGASTVFNSHIVTDGGQILDKRITLPIVSTHESSVPSTTTKRTLVTMAYEECALSGYEFDVTPEELISGVRRLDALMADLKVQGIDLNYNQPATLGEGDLDDDSGIPDAAANGVALQLALRIAPTMRKTLSVESKVALARSMNTLRAMMAVIPDRQLAHGTPLGVGNRRFWPLAPFSA